MSKNYNIFEKVISIILIIWGGITLYELTDSMINMYSGGVRLEIVRPGLTTVFKVLLHFYASLIVSIASIISGILLLSNKKTGWIIAIIVLLTEALYPVLFILLHKVNPTTPYETDVNLILYGAIWCLIFATQLSLLLLKPFRLKYSPTSATYLFIIVVTGLVLFSYNYNR
jgi:hypothetical protein